MDVILDVRRMCRCGCAVAYLPTSGGLRTTMNSSIPGDRGAAEGPVDRLPAHPVLAQSRDDVRGRRVLAVLPDAFGLDHPLVAVAGPVALAVAPLGVEDPGLELAPAAGPSRSAACRESTGWPWVFMVNSRTRKLPSSAHLQVVCTTASWLSLTQSPDQPLQFLQAVVGGEVVGELVADGGLEPVAVVLDVDGGEAGDLGRPAASAGVIVARPSSRAVSGPRKRSESTWMAMVLPGLSANDAANWSRMAARPSIRSPCSSTTRASPRRSRRRPRRRPR